ncbi:MAG: ArgE/DapE family deacylase [Actinomycetes bacterium]
MTTDSAARHMAWRSRVRVQLDDDLEETVSTLSTLVGMPSVSGSDAEYEIQEQVAALMAADGLDVDHWRIPLDEVLAAPDAPGTEVTRIQAWGLVGRLAGSAPGAPSLLLDGHVDVVPPGDLSQWTGGDPWSGRVQGDPRTGRLFGRGAADMKGGIAAALAAVRALRRADVPLAGEVLLATVPGEEDGGLGTFATLHRGYRADACVVPEPTGLDVVPACAGALTFRLRVPGRSAHASRRTEGVSALDNLWLVHRALADLERRRNTDADPLMGRWAVPYPLSLGVVRGGDWASSVPDLVVAEGRLGVALEEHVGDARAALERAVAEACADDPWLADHPVTVEWWGGQFASGRLPHDSDLLARVRRAHEDAAPGRVSDVYGVPYGSDLRLLTVAGIPTLHYGPGDLAVAHAPDEYVDVAEVHTAARTLALLALDLCGTT